MLKPRKRKPRPLRRANTSSCPCPQCGASSRVLRTSLGARVKKATRDRVIRERICLSRARHRFVTEESPRR